MSKMDIDALLKANPKAAEHADSIHKTLKDINALRKAGLGGDGFDLVPPFGRPASLGRKPKLPKASPKDGLLNRLKETHNA